MVEKKKPILPSPKDLFKASTKKNQDKPTEISPEDKRRDDIKKKIQSVEGEYKKMIYRETHKDQIVRNWIVIIIGVGLALMMLIGIGIAVRYIPFIKELLEPPPPPPQIEQPPDDYALEIQEVTLLPRTNQEGFFDFVAKVYDNNVEWGASEFDYRITLLDDSKNEVGLETGNNYILPSQTKYITRFGINAKGATSAEMEIVSLTAQKMTEERDLGVEIYGLDVKASALETSIFGFVENKGIYDLDEIKFIILLLDTEGKIVGINTTTKNTFLHGEKREFFLTWPYQINSSLAVVESYVNVYNSNTFADILSGKSVDLEY
ncbi:MAG: hypothetical protein ABIE68_01420 [bacterium]